MFQIIITFITALFIEGLGSLVSVIGISMMFGNNLIISALIVAIDIGKIIVVSALFNFWRTMPKPMVLYAGIAMAVSMVLTSGGAAGYLHGEFQKAIIGSQEGAQKIVILKDQQAKYQQRKDQIDNQIANLPARTSVGQRLRLINGFKDEQKELDLKIAEIDKQLPNLQINQIGVEAKAAPIFGIAKAFDVSIETAINWVIGAIILVFDPLAIFLVLLGNFLVANRKKKTGEVVPPTMEVPPQPDLKVEPVEVSQPIEQAVVPEKLEEIVMEPPQVIPPAPMPENVPAPVLEDAASVYRKEETPIEETPIEVQPIEVQPPPVSSLHLIKEDPNTIIDSQDSAHFKDSIFKDSVVSTNKLSR